jgi:hypothetical protein
VPTADETEDAAIQVQAFIVNVYGCLDNLAWVWVKERNVTQPNGADLPPGWMGLRKSNTTVRKSLGEGLRQCLESLSGWFEYLEGYRDALAHQIPLYMPPYSIAPDDGSRYADLQETIGRLSCRERRRRYGLKKWSRQV